MRGIGLQILFFFFFYLLGLPAQIRQLPLEPPRPGLKRIESFVPHTVTPRHSSRALDHGHRLGMMLPLFRRLRAHAVSSICFVCIGVNDRLGLRDVKPRGRARQAKRQRERTAMIGHSNRRAQLGPVDYYVLSTSISNLRSLQRNICNQNSNPKGSITIQYERDTE